MIIEAKSLGKKYAREWIFRGMNAKFKLGAPTAIIGPNGSGKSTLLQILSGYHLATEGEVNYTIDSKQIAAEDVFQFLSISAPYLELVEELSLDELLDFHFKFKPLLNGLDSEQFKEISLLSNQGKKEIRQFSSGMKQRLKLALCFFTESKACLLDEPTSNLDSTGVAWYQEHVQSIVKDKVLIICSNQKHEYECCKEHLLIPNYK